MLRYTDDISPPRASTHYPCQPKSYPALPLPRAPSNKLPAPPKPRVVIGQISETNEPRYSTIIGSPRPRPAVPLVVPCPPAANASCGRCCFPVFSRFLIDTFLVSSMVPLSLDGSSGWAISCRTDQTGRRDVTSAALSRLGRRLLQDVSSSSVHGRGQTRERESAPSLRTIRIEGHTGHPGLKPSTTPPLPPLHTRHSSHHPHCDPASWRNQALLSPFRTLLHPIGCRRYGLPLAGSAVVPSCLNWPHAGTHTMISTSRLRGRLDETHEGSDAVDIFQGGRVAWPGNNGRHLQRGPQSSARVLAPSTGIAANPQFNYSP